MTTRNATGHINIAWRRDGRICKIRVSCRRHGVFSVHPIISHSQEPIAHTYVVSHHRTGYSLGSGFSGRGAKRRAYALLEALQAHHAATGAWEFTSKKQALEMFQRYPDDLNRLKQLTR